MGTRSLVIFLLISSPAYEPLKKEFINNIEKFNLPFEIKYVDDGAPGTKEYANSMSLRYSFICDKLSIYKWVIVSDLDVYILQNPVDFFNPNYDMLCSQSKNSGPFLGFAFVSSNDKTKKFFSDLSMFALNCRLYTEKQYFENRTRLSRLKISVFPKELVSSECGLLATHTNKVSTVSEKIISLGYDKK